MQSDLTKISILMWINCVLYLFGVIFSVYLMRSMPEIVIIFDASVLALIWFLAGNWRVRFFVVFVSIALLQVSIALKAEEHPVANPWIALISFIVFLVSLFFTGKIGKGRGRLK